MLPAGSCPKVEPVASNGCSYLDVLHRAALADKATQAKDAPAKTTSADVKDKDTQADLDMDAQADLSRRIAAQNAEVAAERPIFGFGGGGGGEAEGATITAAPQDERPILGGGGGGGGVADAAAEGATIGGGKAEAAAAVTAPIDGEIGESVQCRVSSDGRVRFALKE